LETDINRFTECVIRQHTTSFAPYNCVDLSALKGVVREEATNGYV